MNYLYNNLKPINLQEPIFGVQLLKCMPRKLRLAIIIGFVAIYFVLSPFLILYSLGYRFDFKHLRIVSTGGIYLRTWPEGAKVSLNGKEITEALFSNELLIQGLNPNKYLVNVEKENYSSWSKTLLVEEKSVNKVESVTLIKNNIVFSRIVLPATQIFQPFSIKNGNLYNLEKLVQKDVVAFKYLTNEVIFLTKLGNLIKLNLNGNWVNSLNVIPLTLKDDASYEIISFSDKYFIKENNNLFALSSQGVFEKVYGPVNKVVLSPLSNRYLYCNNHELLFSNFDEKPTFISRFSEIITDCAWLNNNYVLFVVGGRIKISEINTEDRINMVEIPQTITLSDNTTVELVSPEISWNYITRKLTITSQSSFFESEPLIDKENK